jgi:hypothetical protein
VKTAVPIVAIVLAALSAGLVMALHGDPSTGDIDDDLKALRNEIESAAAESEKYSGGLLKALIDVRLETLRNTEAMLRQKRAAIFRRIQLSYSIEAREKRAAPNAELEEIKSEIEQAERRLADSNDKASQYSGGLVHSMAMLSMETDRLSVSQLRLKFYSAKWGLPVVWLGEKSGANGGDGVPALPGKVVPDREAL